MPQVFRQIIELLSKQNIEFLQRQHEPTPTSADSARVRGESISSGAKAIVYKIQDEFYLFVMAADRTLDTKKIRTYFKDQGRRAKKTRFASIEELKTITGLPPGAVPPFGRPILDLDLFVDHSLLKNTKISFNAGSLQHSVTMQLEDYISLANPIIFEFTSGK